MKNRLKNLKKVLTSVITYDTMSIVRYDRQGKHFNHSGFDRLHFPKTDRNSHLTKVISNDTIKTQQRLTVLSIKVNPNFVP